MTTTYPTEDELDFIKKWSWKTHTIKELLDHIKSIWWMPDFGWRHHETDKEIVLDLATGGWSGNEEIISAMHENFCIQHAWQSSFRGGKYCYVFDKNIYKTKEVKL